MLETAMLNGRRLFLIILGLFCAALIAATLIGISIVANNTGHKNISGIIMIVVMLAALILAAGAFINHYAFDRDALTDEVRRQAKQALNDFFFWVALIFGSLALMSFYFQHILAILITGILIATAYKVSRVKKYVGAIAIILMVVTCLKVGLNTWGKDLFNYNPDQSYADQTLVEINKDQIEEKKWEAAKIKLTIPEEEWTPEQKKIVRKYGDPSTLGRIKAFFSSIAEASETQPALAAPAPEPAPATQVTQVTQVQVTCPPPAPVVINYNGWKIHYADGGHNTVTETIRNGNVLELHTSGPTFTGNYDESSGTYAGTWDEPGQGHGTFSLSLQPDGSATGTIVTGSGEHSIELKPF